MKAPRGMRRPSVRRLVRLEAAPTRPRERARNRIGRRESLSAPGIRRLPLSVDDGDAGLGDLHVLRVVTAADSDRADDPIADLDRVAAAENDQPVDAAHRTGGKR